MSDWIAEDPNLPSLVTGYLGVAFKEQPHYTDERQGFVDRFCSQETTLGTAVGFNGTTNKTIMECNNATDDRGHYLYQVDHDEDPTTDDICAGLNYSAFEEDGSDIPHTAYHAYDATYTIAYGLHSLMQTHGVDKGDIDGNMLRQEILNYVEFDGATGDVSFSTRFEDDGFDVGSRNSGMMFHVYNYHNSFSTEEFQVVGEIHSEDGFETCETCSITWPSGTTKRPSDRPIPETVPIHFGLVALSVFFSVSCTTLVLVYATMYYVYRKSRLIKASQPPVSYIILFGCLLGAIRSLMALAELSVQSCMGQMWVGHLSFVVVFSALIVKTWKVNVVMNVGSMKKKTVTTRQTVKIIAIATLPVVLFLTVISAVATVNIVDVLVSADNFDIIKERRCEFQLNSGGFVMKSLYLLELSAMMYGLYLCYLIRNIPDTISNSRAIAKCKFKMLAYVLFISLVLFVLLLVLTYSVVFLCICRYCVHSLYYYRILPYTILGSI
jgi:hypothetical protein